MDRDLERDAIRKTALRVVPLLAAALFSNFLDRVNLGFAAVTMNRDLGFTRATYGLAAGTFFIGYFLFEIPSNLIMRRVGARLWICRIMITWGLVSAATAFIGGAAGLVVLRFLLGLAEAGFAPGLVLYVSLFFPQHYRGRILAWIMIAQPIAAVIGAPVSALLLELDGTLGLKGWQWMFLLEAPPSILLGIVVLGMLPNSPAEARFLTTAERERLAAVIEADRTTVAGSGSSTIRQAFLNRRVILLSLANIGLFACAFGFLFFLPLIVKAMGGSVLRAGLLSAIPYVAATVATLVMGYQADRTASPEKLVFAATATLALGLAGSAWLGTSAWSLLTLSIAAAGLFAFLPTFWAIPGRHLTGAAAAAGIALINSLGSLGGFIGPSIFGWLADRTGGFSGALGLLAAWAVVSGFLVLASRPRAATATEDKP